MKRKGSLNLSIQAIVIVVIAFVVLGLGLGFVRNQFAKIGGSTDAIQEQIREQVLDDLRRGDKKLSFPSTEVDITKKSSEVIAVGIKNVQEGELIYRIEISQTGGSDIFGEDIDDNFLYAAEVDTLGVTDTRVIPVRITSESASGTGQFKINILEVADDDDGVGVLYDSKTFFITVS